MQRLVIQTKIFSEVLDDLIKKKQLLLKDYLDYEKSALKALTLGSEVGFVLTIWISLRKRYFTSLLFIQKTRKKTSLLKRRKK